jgi:hypothetical protein
MNPGPGIYCAEPAISEPYLTLDAVYDQAVFVAKNTFLSAGALIPSFLGAREDGKNLFYFLAWESIEQKNKIFSDLRALFKAHEIVRFAYFGEAWIVVAPLRDADGKRTDFSAIEPENDPRRLACLQIVAADQNGGARGCSIPFERDEGPTQLGEPIPYDNDMIGGQWLSLIEHDKRVLQ